MYKESAFDITDRVLDEVRNGKTCMHTDFINILIKLPNLSIISYDNGSEGYGWKAFDMLNYENAYSIDRALLDIAITAYDYEDENK